MRSILFTSVLVALAVPMSASAFYAETRSNDTSGNPVPVRYDTTGGAIEFRIASEGLPGGDGSEVQAIADAFATWAAVPCVTIDFAQGPREEMPRPRHWQLSGAGVYILVYWSDDPALFDTPRVGHFDWAHDTMGTMIGGQVILNSLHHAWTTTGETGAFDVQAVVTALIGRVLGLTSSMDGNATYPRYVPGDISKRTLGMDDIAGITYLYGDGTCSMEGTPEMLCDGTDDMCPPSPMGVGDGGMGTLTDGGTMPPRDSGTILPRDGAVPGSDGGGMTGGDDGGCSCSAPGAPARRRANGLLGAILLAGLAALRLRRRGR